MFGTIILSLGSFMFAIMLLVIYIFKIKNPTISNRLFSLLLFVLLIVLGTEIMSVYTIYNKDIFPLFNELICRIHCLSILLWLFIMALYLFSLEKERNIYEFKNYLFKELKIKKYLIIFSIFVIIFFFLDFDYIILKDTAYLSGYALYYTYLIGIIVLVITLTFVLNKQEKFQIKKLPLIILTIETIITIPLSIIFPNIYIMTSTFVFKMFLLYFMIENPDIYVIKQLKATNENIEYSSRTKTEFLSNVTNEIKFPIKSIIGLSESLVNKNEINIKNDIESVKHIYSASNNLIEIINNVLDLSRIETSSEIVIDEVYELKEILSELKSIINSRIKDNVEFLIIYDENIPNVYKGDKTKVYKILLNVLSNSVKYTEVGKIVLKVEYVQKEKETYLNFIISDTGLGIKKEDYDKLFEKFSRLEDAKKNEIEGLGLGLVITKKLVDLMNGEISFESNYGAGTNFYINLKQSVINDYPIGKLEERDSLVTTFDYLDCTNLNVLLVDDNKLNLKVAEKLLKPYNFNITTVTSGKECIYKIKEGNIYDIIFLDHMMPEMDGIEVMHILKKLSKNFDVPPIVALTANAVTGMREMYLKEGFDEYLAKPINTSELNKIINKYFRRKK